MNNALYITAILLLIISGCASPSKLTTWRDQSRYHNRLNKIIVIGIVHDSLSDIRKDLEDCFVNKLKSRGFSSITSLEAFGQEGLAGMEKEQTFIQLCNQGIDAVLTVALLDEKKASKYHHTHTNKYTSSYYYNRILNYQSLQAAKVDTTQNNTELQWEATLFNLSTLSPIYWTQTQPFSTNALKLYNIYCQSILNDLLDKKVLK